MKRETVIRVALNAEDFRRINSTYEDKPRCGGCLKLIRTKHKYVHAQPHTAYAKWRDGAPGMMDVRYLCQTCGGKLERAIRRMRGKKVKAVCL